MDRGLRKQRGKSTRDQHNSSAKTLEKKIDVFGWWIRAILK